MKRNRIIQKVAIAAAVSAICESVYALPPTASPFSSVPANLVEQSTTIQTSSVFPRVMLLVDDSGSMSSRVLIEKCKRKFYNANGNYDWNCRYTYNGEYWKALPRIDIVKNALNDVLDSYDPSNPNSVKDDKGVTREMRWNLISLCGTATGWQHSPASANGYLTASALKPFVNNLDDNCRTPSTNRYIEAANYAYNAIHYKCQKNFIVMLSDGDANEEGYSAYWSSPLRNIYGAIPYGYDAYSGNLGNGISFFSHKLRDADLRTTGKDDEGSEWDGKQNIQTFTVGFGNGLSESGLNYLTNAGAADGSIQTYYKADNAAELVDAFKKIFSNINQQSASGTATTTSTAAPAAMSAQIEGLAANLSLNTGIWGSEIRFNKLDSNGNPIKDSHGANEYYPADYSGRQVIMNNGTDSNGIYWLNNNAGNHYADFGFGTAQQNEFSQAFLPWLIRDPGKSDPDIKQAADNLKARGANLLVDKGYRERAKGAQDVARQMGDVLNTNVVSVDDYVITGANDGMLYIFKKTGATNPPYKLTLNYLPGGMPRESDTETLAKVLPTIAQSDYREEMNPHIYGINGNLRYVKTPKTQRRQQQTVLLGTMGQGGRGAFALRIDGCDSKKISNNSGNCNGDAVGLSASQGSWLTSVPLWETPKDNTNKLGYTISKPSIYPVTTEIKLENKKAADKGIRLGAFLANGFKSSNASVAYDAHPTLYVYDMLGEDFSDVPPSSTTALAGTLLKAIETDGAQAALASPTLLDVDQDGVADAAYAGDYNGNLYRFDLRGPVADWKAVKIYAGDSTQPITAAPAIYNLGNNKVVVLVGTGSDIYANDRYSQAQQIFMGVYDDLSNASPTAATKAGLTLQSMTTSGSERTASIVTALPSNSHGWYIELAKGQSLPEGAAKPTQITSAENVVTQASLVLDTVYFTTRIYGTKNSDSSSNNSSSAKETCSESTKTEKSSGSGWLMAVNAKTGGAPNAENGSTFKFTDKKDQVTGIKFDSTLSEVVIMSQSQLGKVLPATDASGAISSGEIAALDTSKTGDANPAKDCVDTDDYSVLVAKADEKDSLISQRLQAKLCKKGGRLIRLNLREIKENL